MPISLQGTSNLLEHHPGFAAHATGAMWLPEERTALVADLHLGYAWAQRRRGQLGPLTSGNVHEKLDRVFEDLRPERLVVLGDMVHAPRPSEGERAEIERAVKTIQERSELILVRGNHDRAFERDFAHLGVPVVSTWEGNEVLAIHGDQYNFAWPENKRLVLGHWHPTVSICDAAGAVQRLAVFLVYPRFWILPAFSPFAAGFDVGRGLPPEMGNLTRNQEAEALAITGERVAMLGKLRPRARRSRSAAQSGGAY